MSILETTLIYVGIPLLVVVLFALLTLRVKPLAGSQPAPYRLGDRWDHEPVLWSAVELAGHGTGHGGHADAHSSLIGGTASGKW